MFDSPLHFLELREILSHYNISAVSREDITRHHVCMLGPFSSSLKHSTGTEATDNPSHAEINAPLLESKKQRKKGKGLVKACTGVY